MRNSCFLSTLLVCIAQLSLHADEKREPVQLFDGKNLDSFYTWIKNRGKNDDPKKVFSVQDGVIRVSGEEYGGLITKQEFENYHLTVEFKWGEKTWAPRLKNTRDSGVLIHCVGEDGAAGGTWMESIEFQLIEGGTGDFILVGGKGKPSLTCEVEKRPTGIGEKKSDQFYWKAGGTPMTFASGRINWNGRDPEWRDVLGFRGKVDVEKPVGEWNKLECICDGDKITNKLNGVVVNVGMKATPKRGKILFQSEGAEIFFRKIEVAPLDGK